ncbi:calcium:proton antiporter [Bauldia sp.]|uniref:calcium:proton antiporter n=1 Tax=Bauldia sp. TaxID=2575872 RepID=UPI003BA9036F
MLALIRSEAAFIVAAATTLVMYTVGEGWFYDLSDPLIFTGLFIWIFGAMIWSAFAAVGHADELAEILGEPYGTLILTISVISIEVAVISAVMLTGQASPELARDTMLAVLMIVLNGMVGLSLLIGGARYGEQEYNLQGARAFLAVLVTLATITLILPRFTTSTADPSLDTMQSILFSIATVALYGTFLAIQTVRHRGYFVDPAPSVGAAVVPAEAVHHHTPSGRGAAFHAVFLVLTLVPIVLLSKKLATLIDAGIVALAAPVALGGVLIALLVLAPEGLAAFRAANANSLQRAVNICLGSALATISLTVPAVIVIGLVTDTHVILGLDNTDMVLLTVTLILSLMTFGGARTSVLQGAVHLVLFFVYIVLIFDP